jgi:hypothetical protein
MHRMRRSSWSMRTWLWVIACTLVLKAAVPLFAAGAAHLQGVPVGSICGIYGVTLPTAKTDPHAHHHEHHGHGSASGDAPHHSSADREHCALTGLASMAAWDTPTLPAPALSVHRQVQPRLATHCAADACAAWAARMQHPPPAQS